MIKLDSKMKLISPNGQFGEHFLRPKTSCLGTFEKSNVKFFDIANY